MRQITFAPTFSAWQKAARRALSDDLPPETIAWEELQGEQPPLAMFDENDGDFAGSNLRQFRVPKGFFETATRIACHRDARRWALLYQVLWRITHGEPRLLEIVVNPAVHELLRMDKAIRHDVHKMRAFVRFRSVTQHGVAWHVAWFEPEHHIIELNAPFFRDRFTAMRWSILSPDRCVHWDGTQLSCTGGVPRSESPTDDAVESVWLNYYGSIFNPARVKIHAMQAEMPKRYWKNLPEAAVIPILLNEAPMRVKKMLAESAAKTVRDGEHSLAQPPDTRSLPRLRATACACRACPLWRHATQTVFGEGPRDANLVLVGEQPGDSEDLDGRPFIGPAGKLLDRALADAEIERNSVYVTNAVKHFKWEPRGKRRIHQTPNARDIAACRPWVEAELHAIQPQVLVCHGGTAAKSLVDPNARVLRDRGQVMVTTFCSQTIITVHPSSLLRAPDEATREANYTLFVKDLKIARSLLP